MLPCSSATSEGKRRFATITVELLKTANNERQHHIDAQIATVFTVTAKSYKYYIFIGFGCYNGFKMHLFLKLR